MIRLAANISTLFVDLDLTDRIQAAASCGFGAVEMQFLPPDSADNLADEIARRCASVGLPLVLFNAGAGDLARGELGFAGVPDAAKRFRESVEAAVTRARQMNCPRIHILAGKRSSELSKEEQLRLAAERFAQAALEATSAEVKIMVEPLSPAVAPDYLIATMEDALKVLKMANMPNIEIQFDLFHNADTAPDPARSFLENRAHIGHLQIANPGDRQEPNMTNPAIATFLSTIENSDYDAWLGCEYLPVGDTQSGLGWARRWGIRAGAA